MLALTVAVPALAAETYYTDQGHTEVRFGWSHAGVSMQTGEFTTASGKLVLDPDNVEQSSISVTIDAASVATGFEALDTHLKSADFLEVETYPEITFESTSVERTGDMTANVTGDLTIHGVTQPVTLETTLTHRGEHPVAAAIDYYKGQWVAFSATTEIDHQAFEVGSFSTGPISITIVTEMKDRE
jgi:polyisoprenoid-binding protein YceI